MTGWLAVWFVLTMAHADSFYLESDRVATELEAVRMAEQAAEIACPGEVHQRYERGVGWVFIFRSSATSDAASLKRCLDELSDRTAVELHWVEHAEGRMVSRGVGHVDPPSPTVPDPPDGGLPSLASVVAELVRAHGGSDGGFRDAQQVLFRFDRVDSDGTVVEHVYARRGADVYLRVDVPDGKGRSSVAGIAQGVPWLRGSGEELDVVVVADHLRRFSPSSVLGVCADLGAGELAPVREDDLRVGGVRGGGTERSIELVSVDGRLANPLHIKLDATSFRLIELRYGPLASEIVWRFERWREVEDGALFPERVLVRRGSGVLDDVIVRELELSPTFPPEWFNAP